MNVAWQRWRDAFVERLGRAGLGGLGTRAHSFGLQHHLSLAQRRFDALSTRERCGLAFAACALIVVLWDQLLMQPLYQRERTARGELAALTPEDADARAGTTPLGEIDAVGARERELAAQYAARDRRIRERAAKLVDPSQMRRLLESLIAAREGLKIVRLANLPVEEIRAAPPPLPEVDEADTESVDEAQLLPQTEPPVAYVHGIEIVVEGSFAAIHDYIAAIEAQGWRFLWRRVDVDASRWPVVRGQLTVATLSLERNWLSL